MDGREMRYSLDFIETMNSQSSHVLALRSGAGMITLLKTDLDSHFETSISSDDT
jgi:hypothetical protein